MELEFILMLILCVLCGTIVFLLWVIDFQQRRIKVLLDPPPATDIDVALEKSGEIVVIKLRGGHTAYVTKPNAYALAKHIEMLSDEERVIH